METVRMKTLQMRMLEHERGQTIEQIIRTLSEQGYSEEQIANNLGVGRVTLIRWNKILGRRTRIAKIVSFASDEPAELAPTAG